MKVKLIAHTVLMPDVLEDMGIGEAMDTDADMICGIAAAKCTASQEPMKSLKGAMNSGHESVAEFADFVFEVDGISRVCLDQLTRHRLMSFCVQSQRYCGTPEAQTMVMPASLEKHGSYVKTTMMIVNTLYKSMIEDGVPEEDARFIMPEGSRTSLILKSNARELRHFFALRCCNRAQWEIRALANEMLKQCRAVAPLLFADAGAGCVRGHCPEGSRSCGRVKTVE